MLLGVSAKAHPALHAALITERSHLRVHAPQPHRGGGGGGGGGAAAPITVVVDKGDGALPVPLVRLRRAR
jgi:hypothetical protein